MAGIEIDYIAKMRDALFGFYDALGRFTQEHGFKYTDASQAATELASMSSSESLVTGMSIANHLIESGGEHVTAFAKTITEPMEPIACWTCVRSMLETCSLAAWLLDPAIDARTRVARIFALRYEGLDQQLKFGNASSQSAADLTSLSVRIDTVENDAIAMGYLPVTDRHGNRIGIGQRMPGATEIIKSMLDEEVKYRLLSAVAHGHFWAINQLGFQPVGGPDGTSNIGTVTVTRFEKKPNLMGMALLGLTAAKALGRAIWNQCRYFGWDEAKLNVILENTFDALQAKPTTRFWK